MEVNETEDEQRTKHGSKWRRESKSSKKVKRVAAYGFIARSQWEIVDIIACPVLIIGISRFVPSKETRQVLYNPQQSPVFSPTLDYVNEKDEETRKMIHCDCFMSLI